MSENIENLEQISAIKKRINEVAFAPLAEHGALFDQVNQDLSAALTHVEGISSQSPSKKILTTASIQNCNKNNENSSRC